MSAYIPPECEQFIEYCRTPEMFFGFSILVIVFFIIGLILGMSIILWIYRPVKIPNSLGAKGRKE